MVIKWLLISDFIKMLPYLIIINFIVKIQSDVIYHGPSAKLVNWHKTNVDFAENIFFKYYDRKNEINSSSSLLIEDFTKPINCYPGGKFAIIVHGWKENCDTEWVKFLVSNLTEYRGGCIICMDYSRYGDGESYLRLFHQFDSIAEILTGKLRQLETFGHNGENGFMFGFSYGSHLVLEAAKRYGHELIKEIDVCDIAGPAFDFRRAQVNHKIAAQNVQCIHTSRDKGSRHTSTCHQNWKMGNCGWSQVAAQNPPKGSHGLCPYFYLSAFRNDFVAVKRPAGCVSRRLAPYWPAGFKMGYMETRKSYVRGELFAFTSREYPYNSNSTDVIQDLLSNDYLDFEIDVEIDAQTTEKMISIENSEDKVFLKYPPRFNKNTTSWPYL